MNYQCHVSSVSVATGGPLGCTRQRVNWTRRRGHPPLAFQAVERVLALFVAGFTAGTLTVRESARAEEGAYTDGQTIFVPPQYAAYPTPAGNLLVYKCTVAHAAAQVRYGTLPTTADYAALREAADPALTADLFTS